MKLQRETWFLLFVTCVLLFVAVNIQAGWLFVLVFSVIAILLCSLLMGFAWTRGKFRIERFASPVIEGQRLDVLIRITNLSLVNKYLVFLEDRIPSKKGARSVFLFFPSLPKGKSIERRYQVPAEKRGVYRSDFLTLHSRGPGGLFHSQRQIAAQSVTMIYPVARAFPFAILERMGAVMPGDRGVQIGKGGEDEFFGIRAYDPGDSLRSIHWASSAKAGKLMVREMSRSYPAFVSFFVDCDQRWSGELFEEMVRLAAYAIGKCREEGHFVRLFRNGEIFQGDGWGNLEALASLNAEFPNRLPGQIKTWLPLLLAEKQLFIFTAIPSSFDSTEWRILKSFQESSVWIHLIFLDSHSHPDISAFSAQSENINFTSPIHFGVSRSVQTLVTRSLAFREQAPEMTRSLHIKENLARWLDLQGISFSFV